MEEPYREGCAGLGNGGGGGEGCMNVCNNATVNQPVAPLLHFGSEPFTPSIPCASLGSARHTFYLPQNHEHVSGEMMEIGDRDESFSGREVEGWTMPWTEAPPHGGA